MLLLTFLLAGCGQKSAVPQTDSASQAVQEQSSAVSEMKNVSGTSEEAASDRAPQEDGDQEEADQEEAGQEEVGQEDADQSEAVQEDTDQEEVNQGETAQDDSEAGAISESDTPTDKDGLAAYIHRFGHLPENFLTKKEAQKLGWSSGQDLWDYAEGYSIGGDHFGNYEGNLPDSPGREFTECDVNYQGGRRGAERIVYSNDGLIYYTADHYETFELLYGEE